MIKFLKWYFNKVEGVWLFVYSVLSYVLTIFFLNFINIEWAKALARYLPGVAIVSSFSFLLILLRPFESIIRRRREKNDKD